MITLIRGSASAAPLQGPDWIPSHPNWASEESKNLVAWWPDGFHSAMPGVSDMQVLDVSTGTLNVGQRIEQRIAMGDANPSPVYDYHPALNLSCVETTDAVIGVPLTSIPGLEAMNLTATGGPTLARWSWSFWMYPYLSTRTTSQAVFGTGFFDGSSNAVGRVITYTSTLIYRIFSITSYSTWTATAFGWYFVHITLAINSGDAYIRGNMGNDAATPTNNGWGTRNVGYLTLGGTSEDGTTILSRCDYVHRFADVRMYFYPAANDRYGYVEQIGHAQTMTFNKPPGRWALWPDRPRYWALGVAAAAGGVPKQMDNIFSSTWA